MSDDRFVGVLVVLLIMWWEATILLGLAVVIPSHFCAIWGLSTILASPIIAWLRDCLYRWGKRT